MKIVDGKRRYEVNDCVQIMPAHRIKNKHRREYALKIGHIHQIQEAGVYIRFIDADVSASALWFPWKEFVFYEDSDGQMLECLLQDARMMPGWKGVVR